MKNRILCAALVFIAAGCGSHKDICKRGVRSVCAKLYTCGDAAMQAEFGKDFGTTQGECVKKQEDFCDSAKDTDPCGSDKLFDSAGAEKAITEYEKVSCDEWKSKTPNEQKYVGDFCIAS